MQKKKKILIFFLYQRKHIKLCFVSFEGLGREAVRAEQPGFVISGTGRETIYQQTNESGCELVVKRERELSWTLIISHARLEQA